MKTQKQIVTHFFNHPLSETYLRSNLNKCKPLFRMEMLRKCELNLYRFNFQSYICASKTYFKFKLSPHVIFYNILLIL